MVVVPYVDIMHGMGVNVLIVGIGGNDNAKNNANMQHVSSKSWPRIGQV